MVNRKKELMKQLILLLLFMSFYLNGITQVNYNSVCYVLNVKGEVHKATDIKLKIGDTVQFGNLRNLEFKNETCNLTVYQPILGSFRLTKNEMDQAGSHESFVEFIGHLLKLKGRRVSLSSRGNCYCSAAVSCFFTDTILNDKNLLLDSLVFDIDNSLFEAENGFYYIQYQKERKRLRIDNGKVVIVPSDLFFNDSTYRIENSPQLILGMVKSSEGKITNTLVTKAKFNIVSMNVLSDYYKVLKEAMPGADLKTLYDAFSTDVYIYFGKPTECQLDKIINSVN